jgi:hypothetical protein
VWKYKMFGFSSVWQHFLDYPPYII